MVKLKQGQQKTYQVVSLTNGTCDQGWFTAARNRRHALALYKQHRMSVEHIKEDDKEMIRAYDRCAKNDLMVNVWVSDEYGDGGRIIKSDKVVVVPCSA